MGVFLFVLSLLSCYTDYSIGQEKKVISEIKEVEVIVEVPVETVVEIEVPVYIEVEVPVNEGEIWVDSFTQHHSIEGIDILWVIDRSGSMHIYNSQLLAGIEAMLLALPTSDWRLVMISADPRDSVVSTEFPLIPGDDIVDAADMMSTLGNGALEEGFESVFQYIVLNPYSSTWMRPEAGLLVVFVSDEEEQSNVRYPLAMEFVSWYRSLRGGSVFMASIVNHEFGTSLCSWAVSPLDVGERYMEATNAFGGVVVDICDSDWSPGVTDATRSLDPIENIKLTHQAEEDSIRVFINGSLNYDWYYQASDNTVYFTIVPSGGDLVEVGYRYIAAPDTGDSGL